MIGKNWQVIVYLQVAGLFLHRVCSASTGEKVIAQLQVLLLFTPSLVHSTKCKALVFPTSHQQRRSAESRRAVAHSKHSASLASALNSSLKRSLSY